MNARWNIDIWALANNLKHRRVETTDLFENIRQSFEGYIAEPEPVVLVGPPRGVGKLDQTEPVADAT